MRGEAMTQISLDYDSKRMLALERKFANAINVHMPLAAKRAMEDASETARIEMTRIVREKYDRKAVPSKEINTAIKRNRTFRLPLDDISKMLVTMRLPGKTFGLLRFVDGRKTPAKQKGVEVKNRKKLRVKIQPGITTELKRAFIAKGSGRNKATGGSNYQVFTRKTGGSYHRKATPSMAHYIEPHLGGRVKVKALKKLTNSFHRNLKILTKGFVS